MPNLTPLRLLFVVAAAYDGLLGLLFLVAGARLYALTGITPPNHWGYVDFGAALLVVFGLMFAQIASDPGKYRVLIPYGVGLKACYIGTVVGHTWFGEGLPALWLYFAAADAVFAVLFVLSLRALPPVKPTASGE